MDAYPLPFLYGGCPTDVYSEKNLVIIMAAYVKVVHAIYSSPNTLGSKDIVRVFKKYYITSDEEKNFNARILSSFHYS